MGALLAAFDTFIAELKQRLAEQVADAKRKAAADYFAIAEERIGEIFSEVVSDWYGDYSPVFYSRNESMRNILETSSGDNFLEIGFNSEAMTSMRNGGSVYALTFRSGYHGGAPAPDGAMRYRTPYPYYKHWGRVAAVSNSPLEEMRIKCSEYAHGEGQAQFNTLYHYYLQSIRVAY